MPPPEPTGPTPEPSSGTADRGTTVPLAGTVVVDVPLQATLTRALAGERLLAPRLLVATAVLVVAAAVGVTLDQGSPAIGVVGGLVMLGIVVLLVRGGARTGVARGYPAGETLGVGFGDGVVRLDTGELVEVLDLALVDGVSVRAGVVLLRLRDGGRCLLPASLVPDDALAMLRADAGRTAPDRPSPFAAADLPWHHLLTTDDADARRTHLLGVVRRARRGTYAAIVVLAVALSLLRLTAWPLLLVLLAPVVEVVDRWRVGRVDTLLFAAGTPIRAGVVGDRFVAATPLALFSRPLALLTGVEETGGLVVLRWNLPSSQTQYPAALLGPAAVAALREHVAEA